MNFLTKSEFVREGFDFVPLGGLAKKVTPKVESRQFLSPPQTLNQLLKDAEESRERRRKEMAVLGNQKPIFQMRKPLPPRQKLKPTTKPTMKPVSESHCKVGGKENFSIGSGGYGSIFMIEYNGKTGYVLKLPNDKRYIEWVEIAATANCESPYIIKLEGVEPLGCEYSLGLIYKIATPTSKYIERSILSLNMRELFTQHLVDGMADLHLSGVIHSDLKWGNTLIYDGPRIVYSDLGSAIMSKDLGNLFGGGILTENYLPTRTLMDPIKWLGLMTTKFKDDKNGKWDFENSKRTNVSSHQDVYGLGFLLLDLWKTNGSLSQGYDTLNEFSQEEVLRYVKWHNFFVERNLIDDPMLKTPQNARELRNLINTIVKDQRHYKEDPYMFIKKLSRYDQKGSIGSYITQFTGLKEGNPYYDMIESMTRLKADTQYDEGEMYFILPEWIQEQWESYLLRPNILAYSLGTGKRYIPGSVTYQLTEYTAEFILSLGEATFFKQTREAIFSMGYRTARAMTLIENGTLELPVKNMEKLQLELLVASASFYIEGLICPMTWHRTEEGAFVTFYPEEGGEYGLSSTPILIKVHGSVKKRLAKLNIEPTFTSDEIIAVAKTMLYTMSGDLRANPAYSALSSDKIDELVSSGGFARVDVINASLEAPIDYLEVKERD